MNKNRQWKGYTLEEIRFQRVLAMMRVELVQQEMFKQVEPYTSKTRFAGAMAGRIAGALNFMDYAMIAITVGRKLYSIFHRKK